MRATVLSLSEMKSKVSAAIRSNPTRQWNR